MYPYNYQQSILPSGGYHCVSDILVFFKFTNIFFEYGHVTHQNGEFAKENTFQQFKLIFSIYQLKTTKSKITTLNNTKKL